MWDKDAINLIFTKMQTKLNLYRENVEVAGIFFFIFWQILSSSLQLNKCETDPYFLQNFRCTTIFISAFCKICDLNTEREIVFVLIIKVI